MISKRLIIYAEKAFDNISLTFMKKKMEFMDVGQCFIKGIRAIYSEQEASLIANNVLTDNFEITKGTRQGCPLSPLLFIMVLEVLLKNI